MQHVQQAKNVSERRACQVLGQARSTQRYEPQERHDERDLITRIHELVRDHPRYGYRRIARLLRIEGWAVNVKRIYCLWRKEGLKVPKKQRKRRSLGTSDGGCIRLHAEFKDHVWSMDFIHDSTRHGKAFKSLVVDAVWSQGDSNGDGQVDFADFLAISQNYTSSPPTVPVPEPGSPPLMIFGLPFLLGGRKRKR